MKKNRQVLKRMEKRFFNKALILALSLGACLYFLAPHARAVPLSIEAEIVLGDKFLSQVRKDFRFIGKFRCQIIKSRSSSKKLIGRSGVEEFITV